MPTNDLAEGREALLTEDTIIYTPRLYTFFMAILLTAIYEMKFRNYSLFQQVNFLAGGEVLGKSVYPMKVTVMQGDLPISTDQCGEY